ncbi:PGN_0703 family putative restriction endonuclease [Thermodesulforhabdus norvegica]|uniref:Restriction endonuclease n=1 Tax=Thermodesulforhabdus norvegica TaxID=39841 RepID=A0A1I4VTQ5_9BACT|nr:hypothetical protein [Thermodesulforhabdus norvegica]SFN04570.1 hypothetical protein SAMN05660836_02465 [Thermodesulforhabdus norvegica]
MNAYEYIISKQIEWAKNKGIKIIEKRNGNTWTAYTEKLEDNFFLRSISEETKAELEKGDGNELSTKNGKPKIQALYSSSALAINVFDFLRKTRRADIVMNIIANLFDSKTTNTDRLLHGDICFEMKAPIKGIRGKSPNIDVVIVPYVDTICEVIAIENKFAEPYRGKKAVHFSKQYFQEQFIWKKIPHVRRLADFLNNEEKSFNYLDAAQLIKHILGLTSKPENFWLLYLWYDVPGEEGYRHREEIECFKEVVEKDGVKFHHITYQELITKLSSYRDQFPEYIEYITTRYL